MTTSTPLLSILKRYVEKDPAAAAHMLETMDEAEAVAILKALPIDLCTEVFPYLQVAHAAEFLKEVPPELFEAIVGHMTPDQGAEVLRDLPAELRKQLLTYLSSDIKKQIQELLTFPQNSAGRIMTTEFLAFREDVKVEDAVQRIRSLVSRQSPITYAYVVDEGNHLVGILNMRDLLLASTSDPPVHHAQSLRDHASWIAKRSPMSSPPGTTSPPRSWTPIADSWGWSAPTS